MFRIPGVTYTSEIRCPLCTRIKTRDLILAENEKYVIIVHDFPYNNGHLIITPRQHVTFSEASVDLLRDLLSICKKCLIVLQNAYRPHGFNIDIVQEPHIAVQVVPRWNGDASFVSIFHGVRVVAEPPQLTIKYLREIAQSLGVTLP